MKKTRNTKKLEYLKNQLLISNGLNLDGGVGKISSMRFKQIDITKVGKNLVDFIKKPTEIN